MEPKENWPKRKMDERIFQKENDSKSLMSKKIETSSLFNL
jgi:hypothetical protein